MDYLGTSGDDTIDQVQLRIAAGTPIYGLAGNDTITTQDTVVIGGPGNDTIIGTGTLASVAYWGAPGPVTVDLATGKAQDGYGTTDTLVGIHNVQGSFFADVLLGSAAADTFSGGSGNDLIDGRGGVDTAVFYFAPSSRFVISYNEATGDVTVRDTLQGPDGQGTKTLRNIELIQFSGAGSDKLTIATSTLKPSGFTVTKGVPLDAGDGGVGGRWVVADLNGDGRKDLLLRFDPEAAFSTMTTGNSPVRFYLQQQDGSYVIAPSAMSAGLAPTLVGQIVSADFNQDGKPDFVIAASGQDPYVNGVPVPGSFGGELSYVLMSTSGLNYNKVIVVGMPALFAHHASVGDVSGDGIPDVYVDSITGSVAGASYFLISNGQGGFTFDRSRLPGSISSPLPETFSSSGGTVVLNLGTYTSSALFDANGDGFADLAVLPLGATVTGKVFLNDGHGNFSDARKYVLPAGPFGAGSLSIVNGTSYTVGSIYLDTVAVDVNGDGRLDLLSVVTSDRRAATELQYYRGAAVQILVNTGSGFVDESSQRTSFSHVTGVNFSHYDTIKSVDINADGFADIVLYGGETRPDGAAATRILLNNGHGVFNEAAYPVGVPSGWLAAVDVLQGQYAVIHSANQGINPATGFASYVQTVSSVQFDWSLGRDFFTGVIGPPVLQSDLPGRWVHGNNQANAITLSSGDEFAFGYGGDDNFLGGAGNDTIDGGAGIDTARYLSSRAGYLITKNASGFTVTGGADGTDTLVNVERLHFSDIGLALDIGGNAGTVAKILGAVFGAASVGNETYVGIGLSLLDSGMSYVQLMQLALDVRLGGTPSNTDVVMLLYTNVVGSVPPPADLALYVGLLDSHQLSRAQLGVVAADTAINQGNINLVGLAATGIEFV